MKQQVGGALTLAGISFKRERWLGNGPERSPDAPGTCPDRVDFLCEGGVAIQVRLRARPREVLHQLQVYARSPIVRSLILVTGKAVHLPPEVEGKDCAVLAIQALWKIN